MRTIAAVLRGLPCCFSVLTGCGYQNHSLKLPDNTEIAITQISVGTLQAASISGGHQLRQDSYHGFTESLESAKTVFQTKDLIEGINKALEQLQEHYESRQ